MNILIVDDDDFALDVVENTMTRMGYTVTTAHNGAEAIEVLRHGDIRLMITDWDMPEMNGLDLCRAVRREDLSGYVYVIMLTGREGSKQRMAGLCAGADAFLNKPLDPEEMLVCLKTAERILALETRDVALFALAKLAESRDSETGAHVERVQSFSRLIAKNLSTEVKACNGVDEEYIRLLFQTSPLHDLGKVGIPDAILLKPGSLSTEEFAIMKTHTVLGAETLDAALRRFPSARFLQMAREIAATHHEKFDGSGYPLGLVGEQIPLCGRIVAVADVYDALTSRRVYKGASSHEAAREIIIKERGSHFDPEVVDAFLRAEPQITAARSALVDEPSTHPRAIAAPSLLSPGAVAPLASGSNCKILLVEDDPIILMHVKALLDATGEPVFTATNGEEAIRLINEHAPRVVLSDWVMPKMDGVELCRHVRKQASSQLTHFIMLTGHSDKSRLLDAYAAGVDDFISKPFDAEELLARVRAGIRSAKLHDELYRKATGSQALNGHLATINSRLERLSITDELTGLFNRRHAMMRIEEQWQQTDRTGQSLTVATIDVDRFKQINDTHGHDAGDGVLRRIAGILREQTRGTDTVCRLGGDEFLIIFPSQTSREAHVSAERFHIAVKAEPVKIAGSVIDVSVSVGLATRTREMRTFMDLLKAADEALYAAKHAGRDGVRLANDGTSNVPTVPPAAQTPAEVEAPAIDMQAILKRCGGDPKFATSLLERYHNQALVEVDKIDQALATGDLATATRGAHSLKSMSAYVGADAASTAAKEMEAAGRGSDAAAAKPLAAKLRTEVSRAVTWIAENGAGAVRRCA
jgi:putative two-component system response regulator